jgi:hypothetical protein
MSFTHKQAKSTGLIHLKMQDYGAERSLTEKFIDKVLETGKHVAVLCHSKDEYEGEGNDARIVGKIPLLTGQSAQRVPLKFNEVYWIELEKVGPETKCLVRVAPDRLIQRGSRMGLPDRTEWNWKSVTTALASLGWNFSPA